jgi:putative ABC transport system permease protein
MFNHYLKTAIRNQAKNKVFSIINILGLALGIAASFLIINYVTFQYSYDNMHSKKDRIYRVESRFYEGKSLTDDWATSSFGYASALSQEMTGIENYVRFGVHNSEQIVSYNDKRIRETGIAYTEPSFFSIFDFKLKVGQVHEQLKRPNTVIITEDVARQFFDNKNPLGKILTFATGTNFVNLEVTGVLENFPRNSHIRFNYLISYETLPNWLKDFWYCHEAYSYLLLSPEKNPKDIETRFPKMAEKYKTQEALRNKTWAVNLVPLSDIHFNPQKQYEKELKGSRNSAITLVFIALIILLTAWINFINLTTARSMERAKEVGVRKVFGAYRQQLTRQFLMESALTNMAALLFAIVLIVLIIPVFNQIIGDNIGYLLLYQPLFWVLSSAVFILGIVLSGFYPAFVMSRVQLSSILKKNYATSGFADTTRKVLVVFQFAASLFLIYGTFTVYKQVKYMQKQSLGVNIEQTIVLKFPVSKSNLDQQVKTFSEKLQTETQIKAVTITGAVPGMEVATFASNRLVGPNQERNQLYEMLTVDYKFAETFGLQLLAGRSFKDGFGNERDNLLINESSLACLGFVKPDDAIGKQILLEGESNPVHIIGVVKNWHQRSLNSPFTPIMFVLNGRIGWVPPKYLAIKTSGSNYESVLKTVQSDWKTCFPESSFDYFILDQFYDSQYKSNKQFGTITGIFTGLAFFITILGLWALTAFTASKRVKEVGVRKVHGANVYTIIYLFSKEIIVLIVISIIISTPISIFAMNGWLQNYAFRTNISFWTYLWGGLITLTIAMITVGWQSWKAATRNPVEALRNE